MAHLHLHLLDRVDVRRSGVDTLELTMATVPARFARLGDLQAAIDDHAVSIEPLLEWADRDEQDRGLGDAPYPPNYPKMPGEPLRVQPSRARNRAGDGA